MPAICDLNRLRCTLGDALNVGGATITRDNLHRWLRLEPLGNGRRFPIGEQFNRHTTRKINTQRPIRASFFPGLVINANLFWNGQGGIGSSMLDSQDRARTDGHRHLVRQPCRALASRGKGKQAHLVRQPSRAAGRAG